MVVFTQNLFGKLCLLSLLSSTVSAAPIATADESVGSESISAKSIEILAKRAPGDSENDPIDATFDITGWESISEQNCYVFLCLLGGKRVFQRQLTANEADQSYTASGAALGPFWAANLSERGTSQINPYTVSAEECPWRSIHLDEGDTRYVSPGTRGQQNSQGSRLGAGYQASRVGFGQWFTIHMSGSLGPYCTAYLSDPQDFSICKQNTKETLYGTANIDPGEYVFFRDGKSGKSVKFSQA